MVGKVVVGDEKDVGGPLAVIEVIFGVGFPNGVEEKETKTD